MGRKAGQKQKWESLFIVKEYLSIPQAPGESVVYLSETVAGVRISPQCASQMLLGKVASQLVFLHSKQAVIGWLMLRHLGRSNRLRTAHGSSLSVPRAQALVNFPRTSGA